MKVDLLRDSLDDAIQVQGFETELVSKVKEGTLPQTCFAMVENTGELIDLEFDNSLAKCYFNPASKEYYRPII